MDDFDKDTLSSIILALTVVLLIIGVFIGLAAMTASFPVVGAAFWSAIVSSALTWALIRKFGRDDR